MYFKYIMHENCIRLNRAYKFPKLFQPDIKSIFTLKEIKWTYLHLKLRSLLIHCDLILELDTEFG